MARTAIQNSNASLYLPNGSFSSSTAIAGLSAGFTFGCWFKITTINAVCRIITNGEAASSAIATMGINGASGNSALRAGYYNGTSYVGTRSSSMLSPGQWYHGVYTFDGTNGNIYINGVLDNVTGTNQPSGSNNSSLRIGDGTSGLRGNVSKAVVYNRAVTAAEVASIYAGNIPTSGLQANYPFNEGAGTIAYDTSGNGNNGTITSPTWTRETPSKTRKAVNKNLVYNGDFEIVPPFTAATTTSSRWIDGTASGSTTNDVLGWGLYTSSGTVSAMFDTAVRRSGTASMKISTTATASYIEVGEFRLDSAAGRLLYNIPVLPNTSYTASFYMKTLYVSGDATTGPGMNFVERNGASSFVANNINVPTKVTTDWTQYTVTFTTAATTRFVSPTMRIYGHQGTGTLIMDAWYDSIELRPTTATARVTAGTRLPATNRLLA
jgi:hypothetical protein